MNSNTKRTQRDYSLSFKLSVVDQVEKGEMTYKQAQDFYGIQGRSTILVWLRKHGRLNWSEGAPTILNRGNKMDDSTPELTPEQRIKALEKELDDTKTKAAFFEAVVNVLESDYRVRVVKKRKDTGHTKKNNPFTLSCESLSLFEYLSPSFLPAMF